MTFTLETFFIKSTQELTIYISTLVIIDVQNSQPPCGISSPHLVLLSAVLYWMHIDRNCIDFFL